MTTSTEFPGFKKVYTKHFFRYPTELEKYWHLLSGSEQKLLDFILRRTFGYQKLEDKISLSQFVKGVGKNGKGPGVSRAQVQRALTGLERKGFIAVERDGYHTRLIKLVLREEEAVEVGVEEEMVVASGNIAYLISQFDVISPHLVERYLKDKKQISATERLLAFYGLDEVEQFIEAAKYANGKPFAPTISSPADLEEKLTKLVSFVQRTKAEEDSGFHMTF